MDNGPMVLWYWLIMAGSIMIEGHTPTTSCGLVDLQCGL